MQESSVRPEAGGLRSTHATGSPRLQVCLPALRVLLRVPCPSSRCPAVARASRLDSRDEDRRDRRTEHEEDSGPHRHTPVLPACRHQSGRLHRCACPASCRPLVPRRRLAWCGCSGPSPERAARGRPPTAARREGASEVRARTADGERREARETDWPHGDALQRSVRRGHGHLRAEGRQLVAAAPACCCSPDVRGCARASTGRDQWYAHMLIDFSCVTLLPATLLLLPRRFRTSREPHHRDRGTSR
jgi:hypothetical protein